MYTSLVVETGIVVSSTPPGISKETESAFLHSESEHATETRSSLTVTTEFDSVTSKTALETKSTQGRTSSILKTRLVGKFSQRMGDASSLYDDGACCDSKEKLPRFESE